VPKKEVSLQLGLSLYFLQKFLVVVSMVAAWERFNINKSSPMEIALYLALLSCEKIHFVAIH
jgi:hypothetical protein